MKKNKTNVFRGIASVSAAFLAVTAIGQLIANENRSYMDEILDSKLHRGDLFAYFSLNLIHFLL